MAVLCNRKGKTSFSAWHWHSSHNVENEEMTNVTVKNKERKKTVLGHENTNRWVKHKVFASVHTIARSLPLKYS